MGTHYLWDDVSDNIVAEYDDEGNTIAQYTTEPTLYGNVISQRRSGQSHFFHYDGTGSTVAVTNNTATVTDTRAYTAFGETTESTGTTEFPFQYVGQKGYYRDKETGEYSVRRRMYESIIGQWKSVDPILFSLSIMFNTAAHHASGYVYVSSNPLLNVDPSGLATVTFKPQPWSSVCWKNTNFRKRDGKEVYDGLTSPMAFIECTCATMTCEVDKFGQLVHTPYPDGKARLLCHVQIEIDFVMINERLPDADKKVAYGHEQLHVRNNEQIAISMGKLLTDEENRLGLMDVETCSKEKEAVLTAAAARLGELLDRESRHALFFTPENLKKYEPRGGVFPEPCGRIAIPPI